MKSVLFVLFPVLMTTYAWADSPAMPQLKNKSSVEGIEPQSEASEEKPKVAPTEGPHKGHLVAAGNFYLEILWESDFSAKIYLLDAEYKNETVQNSEVGIFIQSGNTESELGCQPVENYFECKQGGKKIKKGQLAISAKRSGAQAEEVKVKVPFEKKAEEKDKKSKDPKKK